MKTGPKPRPTVERFWAKVEKTEGCWIWRGSLNNAGYGKIIASGRLVLAHRASWAFSNGPVPSGLLVLHRCDNPPCVRPDHLFLGSYKDNMADMYEKGRQGLRGPRKIGDLAKHGPAKGPSRGEDRWSAKLTEAKVAEIRARYGAGGVTQRVLAAEFGVRQGQISRIVRGRRWAT